MSVGLLIVTHDGLGAVLLDSARQALGSCPLRTEVLGAGVECDPEDLYRRATGLCSALDEGDGVLVLTDLYGATPSNVAERLVDSRQDRRLVAGVNLPMLIRIFNYPDMGLEGLVAKALSAGRDGVLQVAGVSPAC
ncbi:MAG: PTS sugar transporter subunit IIA [Gammaproteobacteria bacterium]